MTHATTGSTIPPAPSLETAGEDVHISFERFRLTAGIGALGQMLREDANRLLRSGVARSDGSCLARYHPKKQCTCFPEP